MSTIEEELAYFSFLSYGAEVRIRLSSTPATTAMNTVEVQSILRNAGRLLAQAL